MVDLEAAQARHEREDETDRIVACKVCGECGNKLVAVKDPALPERVVKCGANKLHVGFERAKGVMQLYREGATVPLHTAQRIDDMLEKQKERRQEEYGK